MRNFLPKSVKGGRCNAFNQHYISEISDEVATIISGKLNVNGNICDHLGKSFDFLNKYEKLCAKEFDSKYEDYRVIIQEKKLIILTIKLTKYQCIKN